MTKQIFINMLLAMAIFNSSAQPTKAVDAGQQLAIQDYLTDKLVNNPVVVAGGIGEHLEVFGSSITFKLTTESTGNQLGLYEVTLAPHVSGAKLHYHRFMDETFVVTKGTLTVQLIDREVQIEAGGVIHIPRFTPHGFYNGTDVDVTALMLFNPPQHREDFFRGMKAVVSEQPIDHSNFLQLYQKYDSHPIDEAEAAKVLHQLNK